MRSTIAVALLGALLAPARAADTPSAGPPDGIYVYQIRHGDAEVGRADVTVKAGRGSLVFSEHTRASVLDESASTTFDTGRRTEVAYALDLHADGQHEHVAVHFEADAAEVRAGDRHFTVVNSPSAPGLVVADDLVTPNLVLPLVAASDKAVTLVLLVAGKGREARLAPATTARPASASVSDRGLTFAVGSVSGDIWYDPASMVVDEIDIPAQSVSIRLVKRG